MSALSASILLAFILLVRRTANHLGEQHVIEGRDESDHTSHLFGYYSTPLFVLTSPLPYGAESTS